MFWRFIGGFMPRLWNKDAEGSEVFLLVLMEGERASAHPHDLAREGETDAAALLLRGEEGHKDMGGNHGIDNLLVIHLALLLLLAHMLQDELDAVERLVQHLVLLHSPLRGGEMEGEVAVVDGIEEKRHLLDVAAVVAVEPQVPHHGNDRNDDDGKQFQIHF